jgi:thioredoxin reductase (NADPH)
VLYAIGRDPDTKGLDLAAAGVTMEASGKLATTDEQTTNVPHIFAVGDVLQGKMELTPVAIKAGEMLARRLFKESKEKMKWDMIPTTVFTPAEVRTAPPPPPPCCTACSGRRSLLAPPRHAP